MLDFLNPSQRAAEPQWSALSDVELQPAGKQINHNKISKLFKESTVVNDPLINQVILGISEHLSASKVYVY